MTRYESAIDLLGERLHRTDASLTTSIAEIMTVALQELIEAELTATIGAERGERTRRGPRSATATGPKLGVDAGG